MERTISAMIGKGSVNHNVRAFCAKNVDQERSKDNVHFCHADIKMVYHQLFDGALERYNAKQKRKDRKIDDYYEKIRQGKQEKLFHEVIFQIGNKDDMNARSGEGRLSKEILTVFMEQFQDRNPNLYVFSAHLHMDEESPHLHIDFIPFIRNSKRGLDTRVSLKGALAEQGFTGGTRGATEWNQWIESEKWELSRVMKRYGIRWKQLGTHNKHLSVIDFEKQERQREVIQLEREISYGKEELSQLFNRQFDVERETERIIQENEKTRKKTEELSEINNLLQEQANQLIEGREAILIDNQKLEKEHRQLQQDIENMACSKAVIERNVKVYDENRNWQLSEPGTLMSAKFYRDKYALPLVGKLKDAVKSLTIKCMQLMEQVKMLTERTKGQEYQINRLTEKLMEQRETTEHLQQKASDLERLEGLMGREKVRLMVEQVKDEERAEKNGKYQSNFRFYSREQRAK